MNPGAWLAVSFSMEEKLRMECWARAISSNKDKQEVADLCASLVKQLAYKDKLLKQAVQHIAELERQVFLG